MSNNILDAGIPVLTEIIPAPATAPAEITVTVDIPPELPVTEAIVTLEPPTERIWDEADWERLEREVRERVLVQVLERVDFVLEQRVRDSLADVLQLAVERLANDIKDGLHHSIKDVVSRAVAQEITKLQSLKK
ncbi:hypothetical protein [Noviherbaspirillum sp. Root189]|uniref:hypothetical protein n=1 Tax=Noviherbaspirillum sp. Root189 TaxID=1736487 RepID=UPI00070C0F2B|nr:hypothetical protein [Noviherbaspirillum sp. Root189]KRB78810.1 hypothetical protein ASE07_25575 [Noviherbaspirillum sp. Root189]